VAYLEPIEPLDSNFELITNTNVLNLIYHTIYKGISYSVLLAMAYDITNNELF
jgi:hypothetical protein